MAKVSVKNVSKFYPGEKGQDVTAVNEVSLDVADQEFVVLAGPSGCGKSSLLRMVAGLEKTSQGDLFIGDKQVNDLAPKDRDIAMLFQDRALYPHLSVFDNLAFGLRLRKFQKAEIKNRVLEAANILGLESLLEQKPKKLSSDQRRRVAIGRAIVRQAKVLLFDEPLAELDAGLAAPLRTEIVKLQQRLQTTMIYATRDPVEAMTMADRIVVMNKGAVLQDDTAFKVYHEPANLFVAGFFGNPPMNFVTGTLKASGEKVRFSEIDGGTIEVAFSARERPAAVEFIGKPIILGIRPENIAVVKIDRAESRPAAATGYPAIVEIVEPMGAATDLYLETGAHTLVCRSQEAFDRREAGRRFRFEINPRKAHLFDPISTRRLSSSSDMKTDA